MTLAIKIFKKKNQKGNVKQYVIKESRKLSKVNQHKCFLKKSYNWFPTSKKHKN